MKVLVIGATGFVGKAIVAELRKNSIEVVAVGGPKSAILNSDKFIDITNPESVAKLENIKDVDAVVQAAGLAHQFGRVSAKDLWNVNVLGTENVTRLASKLNARHFILISSVLVYGRRHTKTTEPSILTEDSPCYPNDPYAQSKLSAEEIAIEICENATIPLTILRPAPVIGEGSKGNFLKLITLIAKKRFIWLGKGKNRKSLVSVDDVAKACHALLQNKKKQTEVFNISGPAIEMREIVQEISNRLSRQPPNFSIPTAPIIKILKIIPGSRAARSLNTIEKWISDDIYSTEKINLQYQFSAASDIPDAIRREVDWYNKTK